ncbi:MAG: oligosaccharide flippase family protein [Vicinamibacteria bacterium]|nr:oligosaccharide flippase family protein [Vicinamibacteria bacterium]
MPTGSPETSTLKRLFRQSLAYGTADVLGQGINFLLVPLYLAFLEPQDYGALALLILLSTILKIVFRLGLDSGFIRIFYDLSEDQRAKFSGTVALFSAGFSSTVFALVWIFSAQVSSLLFGNVDGILWVRLVAADLLASSFVFVPFALLRIEGQASLFSTYSLIRHAANTVLKVILIVMGLGVTGALISDLVGSVLLAVLLFGELRKRSALAFEWAPLKEALRFGLPKVPHGMLVQTLNLSDRRILDSFVSLAEVGVYQVANSFGAAMKFPLSAFEPAFQPFVFENAKKPGGALAIGQVATRMSIVFVMVALGLALSLPDVLRLVSRNEAYHRGAPIIPIMVLAYLFQGFFLLASVGIAIAKEARYYPMITAAAAALNIGLNLWLIPRFGIMAAAWATVAGYALMAFMGVTISGRLYPIPVQWGRIASTLVAAIACFLIGNSLGLSLLAASARVALSLLACALAWRMAFDEADRRELRKVVGLP